MASPNSKTWEITIANPTEEDLDWIKALEVGSIYIAKETAEGGLEHLQGRIVFKRPYTLKALKKLHGKAHWEVTKAASDWNYYKKIGSVPVRDEIKRKGERSDLAETRKKLKSTHSIASILEDTNNYNEIRMCEAILKYSEPQRPVAPIKVIWYWGETGTGKTKKVYENHPPDEVFRPVSHKWWEGYDGHRIVLLDDFRKDFCKFHELLTLLDIYPFRVETKGGSRQMQATTFYITSCFGPADLYDSREDVGQLLRRVTEEWKFTALGPVLVKGLETTQIVD